MDMGVDHCVKIVRGGGHPVAVVEVSTDNRPVCLINVYLPSRGSASNENEFMETLDELHEVLQTFSSTHDIIIGGDFNASLHRTKTCGRDQSLRCFVNEHGLFLSSEYPEASTFFHTAGDFSSQIDYFFVTEM